MIIDTHHHFWQFNPQEYSWIDEEMRVLRNDFLPLDLEKEISEAGVSGTVVVQARQSTKETEWLLGLYEKYDFIKGVVGWLDLSSAELGDQLKRYATHPGLCGLRHVIHDEEDDNFMLRPAFLRGIEQLSVYKLCYDLLLFPKHLTRAVELASRFPEQRFVLDHISKPFIKSGIIQPWKDDIEALAAQPNVWCKVSGMVTEADHQSWRYDDFLPYLDVVCEAFGQDRLMLGSDWPVCRMAGDYATVMSIPLRYFRELDMVSRELIFYKNALNCYQLEI